jgi:hypothetical protein
MITLSSTNSSQVYQQFSVTTENSSEITASNNQHPSDTIERQQDTVSLSGQGRELSAQNSTDTKKTQGGISPDRQSTQTQNDQKQRAHDLEILQQLKKRDTDVRAHEQAHLSVAGRYAAGSASYSYQTGPDGVKYAIGGEVPIDISAESTPEATIQKMETVRRAALAPADPSPADLQIAADASAKEIQAMQELQVMQREKANSHNLSTGIGTSSQHSVKDGTSTNLPSPADSSAGSSSRISAGNSRQMMIQAYQAMVSIA